MITTELETKSDACRECGVDFPADAPMGLCPHCLFLSAKAHASLLTRGPQTFAEPPSVAEVETLLAGQFSVSDLAGRGGMGAVYRARQVRLDREVAIKLLPPPDQATDPEFPARFLREAKALAKLNHPNIVTLFEFGETAGHFYLVMEYVDGASLEAKLQDGPVDSAEALRIVSQVCDAIQFAHDHGVVHRDIKPGNVLLSKEGFVKVADFGLAKVVDPGDFHLSLTWINRPLGTPLYMAPEQHVDPLNTDHRADVYSLGVLLYELLTGRLPSGKFPPPSHFARMDPRLDSVVIKALEFAPEKRYQSVSELHEALIHLPEPKSLRRFWLFGGMLALLIAAFVAAFTLLSTKEMESPFTTGLPPGKVVVFGSPIEPHVAEAEAAFMGEKIVSVAASDALQDVFSLALTQEGVVLGAGGENLPPIPQGLEKVVAIDAGRKHAMALTAGNVVCIWSHEKSRLLEGLPRIRQISAAGNLSVALTQDGRILSWGTTQHGQEIVFDDAADTRFVEVAASADAVVARDEIGQLHVRGEPGSTIVKQFSQTGLVADTFAIGEEYVVATERRSWLWGWGAMPEFPVADEGFSELVSGPSTGAARGTDGQWRVWGTLAAIFPEAGANAMDLDFGHRFGLASVPPETEWEQPQPPAVLKKQASFSPHESEIQGMAYSANSDTAWTLTDHTIRKIALKSRAESASRYSNEDTLHCIAYSEAIDQLAVGGDNGKVTLLDGTTFPAELGTRSTECHYGVTAVSYSSDGKLLAAGDHDGQLFLWKGETESIYTGGRPHGGPVASIYFDSTSGRIYSTGWDRRVVVSTIENDELRSEPIPVTFEDNGHAIVQHPKNGTLVMSDWSGTLHLWKKGENAQSRQWLAHQSDWSSNSRWIQKKASPRLALAFSKNGNWLVSGSGDGYVRVWDPITRRLLAQTPGPLSAPVHVVAVTSDNRIVTSGDELSLTTWSYGR